MKSRKPATLFLFLLQPFLGFLFSIMDLRRTQNCIIFVMFAVLWGWSMSFEYTPTDNYRVAANFCTFPIRSFQQILDARENGESVDYYLSIVNLLVHKFSRNAKAYFAVLGFVYGLFCIASIRFVLNNRTGRKSPLLSLFVFYMYTTVSLSYLCAPRFFTSAWILTFVTLQLMNEKYLWIPLLALPPFIHFSYFPIVFMLGGAVFFSNFFMKHEKLLFFLLCVIFLLSFVLSEGVIGHFIPDSWISGQKATAKYNAYVNTNQLRGRSIAREVSTYAQANSIITNLFQEIMKISSFVVICIVRKYKKLYMHDKMVQKIYTFILMLGCICFFMSILRAVGYRFVWLLWLPLYYLLYVIYDRYKPRIITKYGYLLILVNGYTFAHMIYVAYRTIDMRLFYMPLYNVIINGFDFPPVHFV